MDYNSGVGIGIAFAVFYLIYMLFVFGLLVVCYVFQSLGCYTIAKRREIRHPWMAWVPVVDAYLLGCISDQYQYLTKGKNTSRRKVLLVLNIVTNVLAVGILVSYVVAIVNIATDAGEAAMLGPLFAVFGLLVPLMGVSIALMVFRYIALYDLYSSCSPENSVLFLVLSVVLSVVEPFFIFFNRKKDGGMPPRRPEPQAYIPPQPQYAEPRYSSPEEPWNNPEQM